MMGRVYHYILYGMSAAAGVLMGVMMVSIVIDVVLRNLGSQSSAHIFTFNEYFLLLIPLLGAPVLVRERGQIYVEALLMQLPSAIRHLALRLILVLSVITCLILTWYSAGLAWADYLNGTIDVRSLDMPRWLLTGVMPLAFAFMAIEFGRFLVTGEDPYLTADGKPVSH